MFERLYFRVLRLTDKLETFHGFLFKMHHFVSDLSSLYLFLIREQLWTNEVLYMWLLVSPRCFCVYVDNFSSNC